MKLGPLDIIGDPVHTVDKIRLRLAVEAYEKVFLVEMDRDQTECLISYLKGLRDGMGWNRKSAKDRSL